MRGPPGGQARVALLALLGFKPEGWGWVSAKAQCSVHLSVRVLVQMPALAFSWAAVCGACVKIRARLTLRARPLLPCSPLPQSAALLAPRHAIVAGAAARVGGFKKEK
jgi:hypothetical protein